MRASKCGMARQGRGIAEHVKAGQGRERQPGAGWARQACKQANHHVQIAYMHFVCTHILIVVFALVCIISV